jgi:hypothetical protein
MRGCHPPSVWPFTPVLLQCDISQAWAGRARGLAWNAAVTQIGALRHHPVTQPAEFPLPFEIHALRSHNRLYLRAWGHPSTETVFECASATLAEAAKLRAGFDVVSDVSGLSSLPDVCMPQVDRLSASLVASRMGRVVRVCGPLPEVILKLERQARVNGYAAHLATSLAEAEALLDQTR